MEILKLNIYKGWRKVKKCKRCKSIFVYDQDDIKNISVPELDLLEDYVICPVCKFENSISVFDKNYNPKKHGEPLELEQAEENKNPIGFGSTKETEEDEEEGE